MTDFTATPQLYDRVPLFQRYMSFVREEYWHGNQLYIASPFIDAKTVLALVMNTGGRQLIEENRPILNSIYHEYLDGLFAEDEVAHDEVERDLRHPVLFTQRESYSLNVILKQANNWDPETSYVPDQVRDKCRAALQRILWVHFDLRLQPEYDSTSQQRRYFHCKWAASERPDGEQCKVLLTTADLTRQHMRHDQPTDGCSQCNMAYFVDMRKADFKKNFLVKLKEICPNNMGDFTETPQLYDVAPLYEGYMSFVRKEYLRGNQLYFASPFIDAKTVLALVMNTGGRQLIDTCGNYLNMYSKYLDRLRDEGEVKARSEKPVLFTRLKSYFEVIPNEANDWDPETSSYPDDDRNECRVTLTKILREHFHLRLQPQQLKYFHCKWAASERPDRKKCKVLLTSANLTTTHMQREKPINSYSQRDMAYVVSMEKVDLEKYFLGQLVDICPPAAKVLF